MSREHMDRPGNPRISRRVLIGRIGAAVGAAAIAPRAVSAQGAAPPPVTAFDAHRDYGANADPVSYPDPDIITVDPAFNGLRVNNTAIHRLWTGGMWSEGPAWSSQGKYLVWRAVARGVQRRGRYDDGGVTGVRCPTHHSSGKSVDREQST